MNEDITIVTACDEGYALGVWLLISSIRMNGMEEKILVGAYNWSDDWKSAIGKFSNVSISDLPIEDKRSVTCSKPEIMLRAQTDWVIWIDCDGILTGNCYDVIRSEKEMVLVRPRSKSEIEELYRKVRLPEEDKGSVPESILRIWRRDVGDLNQPRYDFIIAAAILGVYLPNSGPFLKRWIDQMRRVLPNDVSVVDDSSIAYFQTDESVFNSMFLFDSKAPEHDSSFALNHTDRPHFIHFAFNPKPWIMWNRFSFRHFDKVMDIVEWAEKNGYAENVKLPYTFKRKNKTLCRLLLPFSGLVAKIRKHLRKYLHKI